MKHTILYLYPLRAAALLAVGLMLSASAWAQGKRGGNPQQSIDPEYYFQGAPEELQQLEAEAERDGDLFGMMTSCRLLECYYSLRHNWLAAAHYAQMLVERVTRDGLDPYNLHYYYIDYARDLENARRALYMAYSLIPSAFTMADNVKAHADYLSATGRAEEGYAWIERYERLTGIHDDFEKEKKEAATPGRHFDLHAHLQPAKRVSGDLYDYILHNDKLYFIVGDVSGKGVSASLYMAMATSTFRSFAKHCDKASDIVRVLASLGGRSSEKIVDSCVADVEHFVSGAPQADDITMLVITYLGNGKTSRNPVKKPQAKGFSTRSC